MRRQEPAPPPDPRLDRYRQGVAHVYDGERLVAHLSTRVAEWWTAAGPWWRRRWVGPCERVSWMLWFEPDFDLAHPSGGDDGVHGDADELDRNEFAYRGRVLRAVWLTGEQARTHLTRYGW